MKSFYQNILQQEIEPKLSKALFHCVQTAQLRLNLILVTVSASKTDCHCGNNPLFRETLSKSRDERRESIEKNFCSTSNSK